MQTLGVQHNEQFKIESAAILADVASTTHATFGNFVLGKSSDNLE